MGDTAFDRPAGRDQGLSGDEATKDAWSAVVRAEPAEEIAVEPLQIQSLEKAAEV